MRIEHNNSGNDNIRTRLGVEIKMICIHNRQNEHWMIKLQYDEKFHYTSKQIRICLDMLYWQHKYIFIWPCHCVTLFLFLELFLQ